MKIFITGASGYIGGSVAAALLASGHRIVGLVRSEQRASQVRERGIEPVLGTLSDLEVLAGASRQADAVINTANADDRPSVEAMLVAIKGTGKTFIQTSGSSIVADLAGGEPTDAIYEDHTPGATVTWTSWTRCDQRSGFERSQRGHSCRSHRPDLDLRQGKRCQSIQHPGSQDDRSGQKAWGREAYRPRREYLVQCPYRRPGGFVPAGTGSRASRRVLLRGERRELDARGQQRN